MEETMSASLRVGLWVFVFSVTVMGKPMEVVLRLKEKIPMEQLAATVMDPQSQRTLCTTQQHVQRTEEEMAAHFLRMVAMIAA